jgi:SOS-response transcriptional repressor LexA
MPNYPEMMKLMKFKSKNAVYKLINKMIDDGFVTKDSHGRLIPKNIFGGVIRLDQTVSAGWGSPAEEELADTMSLDEWLIENKTATYILQVQGDSMIDAGILDGDSVLVERTSTFKDGQLVVAQMNDGYVVKYLRKKGKEMYLEPANKRYKNIYPTEDDPIKLIAAVKTIIRRV